ncbi:MAG: hypothetical protein JNL18_10290 [Planctomycetaceae bacterium]|nr:hypothetical protein [Planctomycetaceae bacterium]
MPRGERAAIIADISRLKGCAVESEWYGIAKPFLSVSDSIVAAWRVAEIGPLQSPVRPTLESAATSLERKPAGGDGDQAMQQLLGVFTGGISDDRLHKAAEVLQNDRLSAHEKLTAIHKSMPFPPTASAEQLRKLLGVSASAIKKTRWWNENRKGKRDEAVNERKERMSERGRQYEANVADDD